jgi:hypothetical protein
LACEALISEKQPPNFYVGQNAKAALARLRAYAMGQVNEDQALKYCLQTQRKAYH